MGTGMDTNAVRELLADWQAMFGAVPPGAREWAGGRLSPKLRARHLKIYSLPGGKRYAECAAETALILERQNTLIDALIGAGTPYTLLFTQFGDDADMYAAEQARFVDERLTLLFTLHEEACTPEPFFAWRPAGTVRLYARQQRWARGAEDDLLAATADDEIAGLLLFCPARGVLVAPYDGGVSMIAASWAQRSALRERFASWLPGGSEADPTLVVDSAQPQERETVRQLKALSATVYLREDGAVSVVKIWKAHVDDALLERLGALSQLSILMLFSAGPSLERNSRVTDAGLAALHGLTGLDALNLEGFVGVSEAGIRALRQALPGCEVSWEPDSPSNS